VQVVFLGTNGWYDTDTGNTVCTLVKSEKYHIIFDAGNGLYKVDSYCADKKPAYLFLSHFHLDHIVGLHTLNKIRCFRKLHIFGPTGSRKILKSIINSPFSLPFSKLPFPTEIYELPKEQKKLPFSVDSKPLLHSSLTLGFRIDINGKVISYCPDTGYCENAVELSKNADLLIAECAYKSGQKSIKWPHLNPETAARIAREAGAKKLALVHFDANTYKTFEERKEAERRARKTFKNAFAAKDDMQVGA
jgi:ribonuclease BN (tRNA processing enzyme)